MPSRAHRVLAQELAPTGGFPAPTHFNLAALAAGYLVAYVLLDWASSMNALQGLAITPWNPQGGLSLALLLVYGLRFAPLLALSALIGDVIVRQLPAPLYAAVTLHYHGGEYPYEQLFLPLVRRGPEPDCLLMAAVLPQTLIDLKASLQSCVG